MMLIGSRSQPRPPRPPSHRLSRTPVRDSGRCGRGSRGRLAGSGGDGQLRLAGRSAIPRGRGYGPRSGLGRADRGPGVPRPEPRAPPGRAWPWCRAAGAAQSSASPPPLPVAAGVSRRGTGFHRGVAGLGPRALPAGAGPERGPEALRHSRGSWGGGGRGSAAHLQWGRGGNSRAAALPMRSGPAAGTPASVGGPRSRHCRDPRLRADAAQAR